MPAGGKTKLAAGTQKTPAETSPAGVLSFVIRRDQALGRRCSPLTQRTVPELARMTTLSVVSMPDL